MRKLFLNTIFLLIGFMVLGQEPELVVVTESYKDLERQLGLVKDKDVVKKLSIILQRSQDTWYVMPIIGGKYDYEHPTFTIQDPISTLPSEIWKFKNVESLDISTLGLKKLSDSMLTMTKLRTLNIAENYLNIEENMPLLLKLPALKTLVAFRCQVSQIAVFYLNDSERSIEFLYKNSDYIQRADQYFEWKSKYIKVDSKEMLLLELLKKVHSYYPVGLSNYNGIYPGYEKLLNIIDDTANETIDHYESTQIVQLVKLLKDNYPSLDISDSTGPTFMSSGIRIRLADKRGDGITEQAWLKISVSNLIDYFTVYLESRIVLDNYAELVSPISYTIVRGKKNASEEEIDIINTVALIVKEVFTGHQFTDHYLLMTKKIKGGLPHGQGTDIFGEEFPISSFLFGLTPSEQTKIIE